MLRYLPGKLIFEVFAEGKIFPFSRKVSISFHSHSYPVTIGTIKTALFCKLR